MAVPPYTLYLSLTAITLFLLVAVAIGLEYNAAHSSVAAAVVGRRRPVVVACRRSRRSLASRLRAVGQ